MKKLLLVLSALISIVAMMAFSTGGGQETNSTGGAPSACAGDPSSGGATCKGCHTPGPAVATLNGIITSNIPPAGYTPSATYTITANFVRPGHVKFGFEMSPQSSSGALLGIMANINSQTQIILSNKYITHTSSGVSGSGSKTWNFLWTAPTAGQCPVTFYGMFNATNNNGNTSGDSIFKSTLVVTENMASVNNYDKNNFFLSTFPNPATDVLNIKFILEERSLVDIDLFDSKGYKLGSLFSGIAMNGEVNKSFDFSSYSKGIYFIRLSVNGNYSLQKAVKI